MGANNQPPAIVVKVVRRLDKEDFLWRRCEKKFFHKTHEFDHGLTYIYQQVFVVRRKMFVAARKERKTKNIIFLLVCNGKIFLRREDGDPVIHVTCQDDLRVKRLNKLSDNLKARGLVLMKRML
ncbi:hypothetical protein J6590_054948 [Homalodisca vitripennis]|nr:hypothetical protein J6590_054948 [Homalodisca vitripennis]